LENFWERYMSHDSYLLYALQRTLRDMAGLKVEPAKIKGTNKIPYTNVFLIDSYSPKEISLSFFISLEGKRNIVENILKDNWDSLTHEYIDDCLLELVNVVGGNFFCQVFNNNKYEIGLPYLTFDDRNLDEGNMYYYKTDGILMGISILNR
jgi:hypothetical protein